MAAGRARYAYLGPRGTFCEQAVSALHPDGEYEAVACASIEATLDAVARGQRGPCGGADRELSRGRRERDPRRTRRRTAAADQGRGHRPRRVRAAGEAGHRTRRHQGRRRPPGCPAAVQAVAGQEPARRALAAGAVERRRRPAGRGLRAGRRPGGELRGPLLPAGRAGRRRARQRRGGDQVRRGRPARRAARRRPGTTGPR